MNWHDRLQRSLGDRAPVFFQLATIGPDGAPRNRTITFRGFDGERLLFTTDGESTKVAELSADNRAEICWYFAETREQYRISGMVKLMGPGESGEKDQPLRSRVWAGLSPSTRSRFGGRPDSPDSPPEQFRAAVVTPRRVTHLDLLLKGAEEVVLMEKETGA